MATPTAPTTFVVRSHEDHKRSYSKALLGIALILGYLTYMDPKIQKDFLWITGGLAIGLVLVESAPLKRTVELCVTICPLGVQRTSKVNKDRPVHYPLLPRAAVIDCVVTEHVGAWAVSSHVVFRVAESPSSSSFSSLIPAFPDAKMTFSQCHSLVQQMQRALKETS